MLGKEKIDNKILNVKQKNINAKIKKESMFRSFQHERHVVANMESKNLQQKPNVFATCSK